MIDCFVSCFRINPHNNEPLKVCLNPNSPSTYHFVLVSSLHRYGPPASLITLPLPIISQSVGIDFILFSPLLSSRVITQTRLAWWPQIEIVYNKSSEMRAMFTETLNKVTQGCISHTPLKMIQVFSSIKSDYS